MRVNPFFVPVIVIAALLGSSLIAQVGGFWATSGRTSVDVDNLTAVDLKGWMTLQQVMDGLNISQAELYAAGSLPLDIPLSTALKDLEAIVPGFEISLLRDKFAAPPTPLEPTPMPQPIVTPTPVHTNVITGTGTGTGLGPTPLPPGQILPADQITGRMTLRDVAEQCAVPLDQLLATLNLPADTEANTVLKDLIGRGQIADVDPVRTAVADLQKK